MRKDKSERPSVDSDAGSAIKASSSQAASGESKTIKVRRGLGIDMRAFAKKHVGKHPKAMKKLRGN
jgi:hypothetical protein